MQTNTILPVNKIKIPKENQKLKDEIQTFILGGDLSRKLTTTQKDLCIKTSLAFNLNPLKREVHFIPYNGDIRIVVGYEVYLKRAEKSGKLNGWKVDIEGVGSNMKAVVTIERKDWQKPFIHEVYLLEARQSTPLWLKMPRFMLKKVAIAQAFRLAFPEELGGLPYMPEEIGLENTFQKKESSTTEGSIDSQDKCANCANEITPAVKNYSLQHFGKQLCMQCQRTASRVYQSTVRAQT